MIHTSGPLLPPASLPVVLLLQFSLQFFECDGRAPIALNVAELLFLSWLPKFLTASQFSILCASQGHVLLFPLGGDANLMQVSLTRRCQ